MKRYWIPFALVSIFLFIAAWAHDPRTTAKEVGISLSIEGSRELTIKYRSMHFNQATYERMKASDELRQRLNTRLWNNIGTAQVGFDVVIGEEVLPKGAYQFGLNADGDGQFSLVFGKADIKKTIPLKVDSDVDTPYLTLALTPTAAPDTFTLEARCGVYRGTTSLKVPGLQEHKHDAESS